MKKRSLIICLVFFLVLGLSACNNQTESLPEISEEKTVENKQTGSGKRVYFAAPLFNEAEKAYNLKIVAILEKYGYEVFLPQRDGYLAAELEGLSDEEKTAKIFAKDYEEVLKADILLMNLDGRVPDEGGCVELGIAYNAGKRCNGFKNDARSVEFDMDLNPIISGCFQKLFYDINIDKLIESLETYLKENEL